jgi:FdhD protein
MKIENYKGILCKAATKKEVSDAIAVEAPLKIVINGKIFTITMRMPGDDEFLVRGLLHNEGVLKTGFNPSIVFSKEEILTTAILEIPEKQLEAGYTNSRTLLSVASCGICGKTELANVLETNNKLQAKYKLSLKDVTNMFAVMQKKQTMFSKSGGTHGAAIFDSQNNLLCIYEDIGRHNAVDKVVGDVLLKKNFKKSKVLLVSGRISYEIVIKCFKAGIPFLVAVSAPTSLAIDFAKELGITLLAFYRETRFTCYSYPENIENA